MNPKPVQSRALGIGQKKAACWSVEAAELRSSKVWFDRTMDFNGMEQVPQGTYLKIN